MISTIKGYIWVVCSAIGFGLGPIFAQYAYAGGASVQMTLLFRFLIGAIFLWGYIFWRKIPISREPSIIVSTLLLGGVGYSAMAWSYFSSVQYISNSLAALILYIYPILVMIWSALWLQEKVTFRTLTSLLVAIIGLLLILGEGFGELHPVGLFYAITASVIYSIYIVIGSKTVSKVSPIIFTAYIATAASISYVFIFLLTDEWHSITPVAWAAIVAFSISTMVIAVLGLFAGMGLIGPSRASIISTLEPMVTIFFASLLFREYFNALQWVGGLLILTSVLILVYHRKESNEPKEGSTVGQH
jgi:drug/metabolite transporter (DMT)-like permease